MGGGQRSAVEMLERSHRRLEQWGAELCDAAARIGAGDDDGTALATVKEAVAFFERSGNNHVADEEQSLFPRLPPSPLIERLIGEHQEQTAILGRLQAEVTGLADGQPSDERIGRVVQLANELEAAYRAHTELEDRELLPLVDASLDEAARTAMLDEMRARRGKGRRRG